MIRTKQVGNEIDIIWDHSGKEKIMDLMDEEHYSIIGCDYNSHKHFQATAVYIGGQFSHLEDVEEA